MNMNGGPSTDPHHRAGNYMGMGLSGLPGLNAPPPGSGLELKHHADFLSRLLAATPSYMSEAGSPPPGFFSDWLRRLVSKPPTPTPPHHRRSGLPSPHPPPTPTQPSFSPGRGEMNGSGDGGGEGPVSGGGKPKRKRSRVSDHSSPSHQQKDSASHGSSDHAPSHHSTPPNHTPSSTPTSSASAAAAAAAAASLNVNPFTHPLWFFPPFLPNPYMNINPMNLPPLGLGGLHPGQTPPAPSFLPSPSSPPVVAADNQAQAHPFGNEFQPTTGGKNHERQGPPPQKRNRKEGGGAKSNNKTSHNSSSFSISRLTSPSPSSNSSGGSGGGGHGVRNHPLTLEALNRATPGGKSAKALEEVKTPSMDLRMGRGWEPSPPPRPIYKPLSAFHDPSDQGGGHPKTPYTPPAVRDLDPSLLSTTYVLKNLPSIYQRVGQRQSSPLITPLQDSRAPDLVDVLENEGETKPLLRPTSILPPSEDFPPSTNGDCDGGDGTGSTSPEVQVISPLGVEPEGGMSSESDEDTVHVLSDEGEESSMSRVWGEV